MQSFFIIMSTVSIPIHDDVYAVAQIWLLKVFARRSDLTAEI